MHLVTCLQQFTACFRQQFTLVNYKYAKSYDSNDTIVFHFLLAANMVLSEVYQITQKHSLYQIFSIHFFQYTLSLFKTPRPIELSHPKLSSLDFTSYVWHANKIMKKLKLHSLCFSSKNIW